MTTLDEIRQVLSVTRHALGWTWAGSDEPTPLAASLQAADRMLAALRAVEAVAAPTGDDYTFDLGYAAALDKVRNTIREALGS